MTGRKNWLFSDTPEGANASALVYSIVETAKANEPSPSGGSTSSDIDFPDIDFPEEGDEDTPTDEDGEPTLF